MSRTRRKHSARPPLERHLGHVGTACRIGKLQFPSRNKARRALKANRHRLGLTAVYECGLCGCWHLTSQEQRS